MPKKLDNTIPTPSRTIATYLAVALLLLPRAIAASSSAATVVTTPAATGPSSATLVTDNNKTISDLFETYKSHRRAQYVRQVLLQRLHHVESGARLADFARWLKQQPGGDGFIYSMHGIASEEEIDMFQQQQHSQDTTSTAVALSKHKKENPFPADCVNLDFEEENESVPPRCCSVINSRESQTPTAFQLYCRAVQLAWHFSPVLCTAGIALVSDQFRTKTWYKWFANCIGSAGAAWIKWGQWSSTRSDIFPVALCDALSVLHNAAPAHSWEHSARILSHAFGTEAIVGPIFDEFDKRPIASGSIAQVHRAVIGGKTVAVKIRHERVAQLLDMDFRIMSIVARVFDWIPALSWLHIRESVDQFSHTMAAQSHLNVEAHHLEVLNYNFRNWPHVNFPKPFFASSAVIVESFEHGRIVTDVIDVYGELAKALNVLNEESVRFEEVDDYIDRIIADDVNDEELSAMTVMNNPEERMRIPLLQAHDLIPVAMARFLVTSGVGIYLKMLLVDNLMHADLHPGNIMIDVKPSINTRNKSKKKQLQDIYHDQVLPRLSSSVAMIQNDFMEADSDHARFAITLVDAGMVARLTDEESSTFIGLLATLGEGDGRAAAEFALRFSIENNMNETERESFSQDMEALFAERCRGYGTGVDVGNVLRGVLSLVQKHQVRIDANFATLVVNVLCVESLARMLCPSYNVLDAARPLLESYRKICYEKDGTPKPEARKSKLTKLWLSYMYMKKNAADKAFFKREAQERKQRYLPGLELLQ